MRNIFAIMVTYNGKKWIKESIPSLLDSDLKITLVVIDNNSEDDTVVYIKENYKQRVDLIELNENLGFGKGNNVGLNYIEKENYDYVFLINQDAFVNKDTIRKLVEVAENYPDFSILSPIHLNGKGNNLEPYFQRFLAENNNRFYFDSILQRNSEDLYEVDFVNAAAWLLPRKTIQDIGGFDPIFEHYGEDDNYCQRVHYNWGKIGVVPGVFIRHSSQLRKYPQNYLFSDSYFKDYKKSLQTEYGNINKELKKKTVSQEKRKVIVRAFENIINLRFYSFKVYFKLYRIIEDTFVEIEKSRKINITKNPNYLN